MLTARRRGCSCTLAARECDLVVAETCDSSKSQRQSPAAQAEGLRARPCVYVVSSTCLFHLDLMRISCVYFSLSVFLFLKNPRRCTENERRAPGPWPAPGRTARPGTRSSGVYLSGVRGSRATLPRGSRYPRGPRDTHAPCTRSHRAPGTGRPTGAGERADGGPPNDGRGRTHKTR